MSNLVATPEIPSEPLGAHARVGSTAAVIKGLSTLTDKQEAFAQAVVETGNRSLAYRRAYEVGVTTKPGTIWKNASDIAQIPHVGARIRELQEAAAAASVANKATLIKFLWERILADRRDIINHVRRCCRHCYGERHLYQWKDEDEFALATARAFDENGNLPEGKRKALPSDEGGYGFDPHREPDLTCDSDGCMGDGQGKTIIADTTKLQGAAALIYEGVEETAQGLKIKLADRNADIAQLAKILGWSIDKVEGSVASNARALMPDQAYDIPSTATPEEASRRYLQLVSATS